MENQELNTITLTNGVEITRTTRIAAIEDFSTDSTQEAQHTAGEIYEVSSFELVPDEQMVRIHLQGGPVDVFDLKVLERLIESRKLAIVDPESSAGTLD